MHIETEKKYLIWENGVRYSDVFPSIDELRDRVLTRGVKIRQGYLSVPVGLEIAKYVGLDVPFDPKESRLRDKGGEFVKNFKGEGSLSRAETPEHPIRQTVFDLYWDHKTSALEKVRWEIPWYDEIAEVDVYTDRDLIVAEVETPHPQDVVPLGKDITDDPAYKNKRLARRDFHRKFVLTGGPCSGKTSAIEYLAQMQFPIVPEAARTIIDRELANGGDLVPWRRFPEFQLEVQKVSNELEQGLEGFGTVFLDRGRPDCIAYCVKEGIEPPTPLRVAIEQADYKGIFILDPLPFEQDAARKEESEEAKILHAALHEQYENLGFNPISVPVLEGENLEEAIKKRAHFILKKSFEFQ